MGSLNKACLIGNLGKDAELRYTPGGAAVANFSVATTETWNDKSGQKQEKTEWHRVNVWGKMAESLAQYLLKGKQVYLEGRIETRKWTKDGVDKYSTEIKADKIVLLGGGPRREREESGGSEFGGTDEFNPPAGQPVADDDIPY